MILRAKFLRIWVKKYVQEVIVRGQRLAFFSRGTLPAMRYSKQIGHCDGIGQARCPPPAPVHTQAQADNAHCADEIETGVGADGPVHDISMYTPHGYGKRGLWAGKRRNGAAHVMPDWAGGMASRPKPNNARTFVHDCSRPKRQTDMFEYVNPSSIAISAICTISRQNVQQSLLQFVKLCMVHTYAIFEAICRNTQIAYGRSVSSYHVDSADRVLSTRASNVCRLYM